MIFTVTIWEADNKTEPRGNLLRFKKLLYKKSYRQIYIATLVCVFQGNEDVNPFAHVKANKVNEGLIETSHILQIVECEGNLWNFNLFQHFLNDYLFSLAEIRHVKKVYFVPSSFFCMTHYVLHNRAIIYVPFSKQWNF